MMTTQKNIAFIPVRGGSKSIPNKNIKKLAGKPLVYYSIEAALSCTDICEVIVFTDSQKIKDCVSEGFNTNSKVKIVDRSEQSATDTASTEFAMLEFSKTYQYENIVLIQATSPLITNNDLIGGFSKYFKENANGLVSVVRQKRFVWEESNGLGIAKNYEYNNRPRRQEFDGFLVENGAFYITSKVKLEETNCRISEPVVLWEMPEESYFEIDEPSDWDILEKFIVRNKAVQAIRNDGLGKVKLLLSDVDGVLTDAGMYYSENGDELKKFNTRDGKGFELLRNAGIKTGIITAENTQIVARRAKKMKIDFLYQGVKDKTKVLEEIIDATGFDKSEIAYIGDDLNDIGIMNMLVHTACPLDAVSEVKAVVNQILKAKGGKGAVREFAENILRNFV